MDRHEKQLQSAGICHRFFCFIMKTLAAQAFKPVTLGPPITHQQIRTAGHGRIAQQSKFQMKPMGIGSIEGLEDSECLATIDIEDETCALLNNKGGGCWGDERKSSGEIGTKSKAPRKMVSIKDEPEIIYPNKKRRKYGQNTCIDRDVRPLRSILKVGSKSSVQLISAKSMTNAMMY